MSPQRKKDGSPPKKQLKIDGFLSGSKESTNNTRSRGKLEEVLAQSEEARPLRSPRKRTRETTKTSTTQVENNNNNNNNNEKPVSHEKKPAAKSKKSAAKPEELTVDTPAAKKSKPLPDPEPKTKNKTGSQKEVSATGGKKPKKEKQEDDVLLTDLGGKNASAGGRRGRERTPPPPVSESNGDRTQVTMRVEPGQILVSDTLENATSGTSDGDFIVPHPVEKIVPDVFPEDGEFIGPDNEQDKEYTELESVQDSSILADAGSSSIGISELETMPGSPGGSDVESSLGHGDHLRAIPLDAKVLGMVEENVDGSSVASEAGPVYLGDGGRAIPLETKPYDSGTGKVIDDFFCKFSVCFVHYSFLDLFELLKTFIGINCVANGCSHNFLFNCQFE